MVLCGGQVVVDHQETAQFLAIEIDETVGCDDLRKCVTGRMVLCGGQLSHWCG